MDYTEKLELGDWVLDQIIGSGGFGSILKWRHKKSGDCIAVKKCKTNSSAGADTIKLWTKEVELFQQLRHPGLVQALDLPYALQVLEKDSPVLCMEFCNSGDLRKLLNQPVNSCGLSEREVFSISADISSAVRYLHSRNIIHRDLKPENVVVHTIGDKKLYKLIDFGFAKDLKQQTSCQTFVGTMEYVAPELFVRNSYTSAVDYWGLGFVIHECITGVRPFASGTSNWLTYAEKKSKDHICTYFRADGSVDYSTKLMKENYLNGVSQVMFEEWLRSAVDWNPDTRGRDGSRITIFDKLDAILGTRVLTIFWVDGLRPLHYAVDESASLGMLQEWIERDTGVHGASQLLFTSHGHRPDPSKPALQLYSASDDFTVFLLHKEPFTTSVSQAQTELPELVRALFDDPRRDTIFPLQRRMWAQGCYFLRKQETLLKKLSHGVKLFLGHLTVLASKMSPAGQQLINDVRRLESVLQLFVHSLGVDQRRYEELAKEGGLPASDTLAEQWNQAHAHLANRVKHLETRSLELDRLVGELLPRFNELTKNCRDAMCQPLDWLSTAIETAHQMYAELLGRPREERSEPTNNVPMTKTLVRAMKQCESYFRIYYAELRKICEYVVRFDSLLQKSGRLATELVETESLILRCQSQRQSDVWDLVEQPATAGHQPPPANSLGSLGSSSLEFSPELVKLTSMADRSLSESWNVIQENQSLRYELQTSLTRSLTTYCAAHKRRPDWSFLQN